VEAQVNEAAQVGTRVLLTGASLLGILKVSYTWFREVHSDVDLHETRMDTRRGTLLIFCYSRPTSA